MLLCRDNWVTLDVSGRLLELRSILVNFVCGEFAILCRVDARTFSITCVGNKTVAESARDHGWWHTPATGTQKNSLVFHSSFFQKHCSYIVDVTFKFPVFIMSKFKDCRSVFLGFMFKHLDFVSFNTFLSQIILFHCEVRYSSWSLMIVQNDPCYKKVSS